MRNLFAGAVALIVVKAVVAVVLHYSKLEKARAEKPSESIKIQYNSSPTGQARSANTARRESIAPNSPQQAPSQPISESEQKIQKALHEYESMMAEWKTAVNSKENRRERMAALVRKYGNRGKGKPTAPTFQERGWSTFDQRYSTTATLLTTDNTTVHLRKPDGSMVTIAKEKLDAIDQRYVENAHEELTTYEREYKQWNRINSLIEQQP